MKSINFPLQLIPFLLAILILIWISSIAFQQRKQSKEARTLFILACGVILWMAAYVIAGVAKDFQARYFWFQWVRVGVVVSSTLVFVFALRHSRRDHFFQKWHWSLITPTSTLLLLLIIQMVRGQIFGLRDIHNPEELGLVGYLVLMYGFALSTGAVFILGRAYFEAPSNLRWQGVAMMIGILLPVAISFQTDIMGIEWIPSFDEATFSLVFTVLIFAQILFRRKLFNVWPIAYETILHNIHDGVIVINLDGQVMMINSAGETILGQSSKDVIGKRFPELTSQLGLDEVELAGMQEKPVEFSPAGNPHVMYQMKITVLYDKNHENKGSVVLIHDISDWKRSQKRLTDLATIDYLTGIYNRQHFIHLAQQELLRCAKNRQFCSVIIMDVDHFKSVNDTYGHQTGDQVLKHIMELCRKNFRRVDILGRYGGEEFVALLPEINQEEVLLVAERVRLAIDQSPFITPDANIALSISLGVAMADPVVFYPLDQLLEQADKAMYVSKQRGRNKVSVYSG